MYRRIAPRSNSKLTPPHFQRRFRTLESSLILQTIETSRLRNAINRAFNWAGKVWVRRCCGGSWWNRLCCLCLRCDIDLVKNDAIGKCLDGVADWMTDGVENEAGFFFTLLVGCLHLLIRSRDASNCNGVAMSVPERGRYWSVYQFNPLSPLSFHYLFLAPSFCLLPYSNGPPHYQFLFSYPRLLFSLSLSFPLFFLFLPLSRMFRFKYVSPLRRWRRDAGQRDPVLYQGRTKKKTKSFVVFFLLLGRGWIHIELKIKILFIKFLCWKWTWD